MSRRALSFLGVHQKVGQLAIDNGRFQKFRGFDTRAPNEYAYVLAHP
jgi:hypothetical protein